MKEYVMAALFSGCTLALALTIGLGKAEAGAASNGIEKIGKISGGQQLPNPAPVHAKKLATGSNAKN